MHTQETIKSITSLTNNSNKYNQPNKLSNRHKLRNNTHPSTHRRRRTPREKLYQVAEV